MNLKPYAPTSSGKKQLSVPGCYDCYHFMGAHPAEENGQAGWMFRVWAPNARAVSVVGDFNGWNPTRHPMDRSHGGIWYRFIPGLHQYDPYQYAIHTIRGEWLYKADPYAFHAATRPGTASKLYDLSGYHWGDECWTAYRKRVVGTDQPVNLYEVHLGSWRRTAEGQVMNYRTIASYLVPYVKEMGYTGVLLLPMGEHPDDESLGYQESGYFAVTSRFGTPTDFMYLVDQLHQAGISVVMDSSSFGFSRASFALGQFDGTPCYGIPSAKDPNMELERFDFSRPEVENFVVSSVFFWMKTFHLDGFFGTSIAVDNLPLMHRVSAALRQEFPYRAEAMGTPSIVGDTGRFWYSAWVKRMLSRITNPQRTDPIFQCVKPSTPFCILPISHDIVKAPRPSLVARMQGDDATKFAQARAFYLFLLTHPGRKLTMMGTEFGQWNSWNCLQSLDWHLLQYDFYQRQQRFFRDANALFLATPALWELRAAATFQVVRDEGVDQTMVYKRLGTDGTEYYTAVCFSLTGMEDLSVPVHGTSYEVLLSTDSGVYGGMNRGSKGTLTPAEGLLKLSLPPMSAVLLKSTDPLSL